MSVWSASTFVAFAVCKSSKAEAFCDKEMSETKAKRDDKQSDLDDLNTKIDAATSLPGDCRSSFGGPQECSLSWFYDVLW